MSLIGRSAPERIAEAKTNPKGFCQSPETCGFWQKPKKPWLFLTDPMRKDRLKGKASALDAFFYLKSVALFFFHT
jgi:hypothetical protein